VALTGNACGSLLRRRTPSKQSDGDCPCPARSAQGIDYECTNISNLTKRELEGSPASNHHLYRLPALPSRPMMDDLSFATYHYLDGVREPTFQDAGGQRSGLFCASQPGKSWCSVPVGADRGAAGRRPVVGLKPSLRAFPRPWKRANHFVYYRNPET